jgi:glycosyltransferase involved in cell wall biosynthesis
VRRSVERSDSTGLAGPLMSTMHEKPEQAANKAAPFLSIVVPLLNEEDSVEKLAEKIHEVAAGFAFTYEIIFVDDGSTDGTWERIERLKEKVPHLRGIKFRRNFGQTSAMVAGFDHSCGEVIVTMDGDLQNDPIDIPVLLEKMKEGYDIVSGWRGSRKDHWSRVIPSRVANRIISMVTGVRLHDYGCSLKAYRSEIIKPIKAYGEMHRFFPALASMTGARVVEIPVGHHPRRYGRSKHGMNRVFKVMSDIVSIVLIVKFSSMPLVGFSLVALPFLCLGLLFGLLAVTATALDWTEGKSLFFTFTAGLSFMGVLHLLALGIISEMVVGTSDLSHTQLPQISGKTVCVAHYKEAEPQEGIRQD